MDRNGADAQWLGMQLPRAIRTTVDPNKVWGYDRVQTAARHHASLETLYAQHSQPMSKELNDLARLLRPNSPHSPLLAAAQHHEQEEGSPTYMLLNLLGLLPGASSGAADMAALAAQRLPVSPLNLSDQSAATNSMAGDRPGDQISELAHWTSLLQQQSRQRREEAQRMGGRQHAQHAQHAPHAQYGQPHPRGLGSYRDPHAHHLDHHLQQQHQQQQHHHAQQALGPRYNLGGGHEHHGPPHGGYMRDDPALAGLVEFGSDPHEQPLPLRTEMQMSGAKAGPSQAALPESRASDKRPANRRPKAKPVEGGGVVKKSAKGPTSAPPLDSNNPPWCEKSKKSLMEMVAKYKPRGAKDWQLIAEALGRPAGGASAERLYRSLTHPEYQRPANKHGRRLNPRKGIPMHVMATYALLRLPDREGNLSEMSAKIEENKFFCRHLDWTPRPGTKTYPRWKDALVGCFKPGRYPHLKKTSRKRESLTIYTLLDDCIPDKSRLKASMLTDAEPGELPDDCLNLDDTPVEPVTKGKRSAKASAPPRTESPMITSGQMKDDPDYPDPGHKSSRQEHNAVVQQTLMHSNQGPVGGSMHGGRHPMQPDLNAADLQAMQSLLPGLSGLIPGAPSLLNRVDTNMLNDMPSDLIALLQNMSETRHLQA